jgi:D-glycerate 3-kinase
MVNEKAADQTDTEKIHTRFLQLRNSGRLAGDTCEVTVEPHTTLADLVASFSISLLRSAPIIVGITGPQGCGKSTLAATTVAQLKEKGLRSVTVSIDDFYLTNREQRSLADDHPDNPYLEHRGYPGTHDVGLGVAVLDALTSSNQGEVSVPIYDKGANGGRGDRAPVTKWRKVHTPVDIVLLEGWMLGFEPVPAKTLRDANLREVNDILPRYEAWHTRLDALVHLDALERHFVVDWRIDAEGVRRFATGTGLSDEGARDYIERFLPAYQTYVSGLRLRPSHEKPYLRVIIGHDRAPVEKMPPMNSVNGG